MLSVPFTTSVQAALLGALVVAGVAFALGLRFGRKRRQRKNLAEPEGPTVHGSRVQVAAETGVEVIYNKKGYKIRVEKTWEHRYLAEQCIGRPLGADEVVHHINGR